MELKGNVLSWKLSLIESIAMATTAVSIVLWANSTFQDKADAIEVKKALEERVSRVELELSNLRRDINSIAVDTSYIRGRLEPKSK